MELMLHFIPIIRISPEEAADGVQILFQGLSLHLNASFGIAGVVLPDLGHQSLLSRSDKPRRDYRLATVTRKW